MGGARAVFGDAGPVHADGGYESGQNALIRFYMLHVIVLPLVLALFMAVHFWRIRKDGGISGPL